MFKADGSQALDSQIDALLTADVEKTNIYQDKASGKTDAQDWRHCLKALRKEDVIDVNNKFIVTKEKLQHS